MVEDVAERVKKQRAKPKTGKEKPVDASIKRLRTVAFFSKKMKNFSKKMKKVLDFLNILY